MGVSTDAILVFGIPVGEEDEHPEFMGNFDDFDDYLDSLSGLPQYGEPGYSSKARQEFHDKCPADLVWHCSYEYPMYILAVRGTEIRAYRGDEVEITPEKLVVPETKLAEFRAWIAERGIQDEPRWYLCSMWG